MTDTEPAKKAIVAESSKDEDISEEESSSVQVHSANAWEKADLGDEERKHKFLRLMGAAKKEHHGKVIIGDHNPEHPRKSKETEEIEQKLQEQYEQSLQHRLAGGRRGRIGLGYHDADKSEHAKEEKDDDAKEEKDDDAKEEKDDDAKEETRNDSTDDKRREDKTDCKDKGDQPSRKRASQGVTVHKGDSPEKKLKFTKASS